MKLQDGTEIQTELDLDFSISIIADKITDLPDPSANDKKWAVVKYDSEGQDDNGIYLSTKDADGNSNWVQVLSIPNEFSIQGLLKIGTTEDELGSADNRDGDYGIIVTETSIDFRVATDGEWSPIKMIDMSAIIATDEEFAERYNLHKSCISCSNKLLWFNQARKTLTNSRLERRNNLPKENSFPDQTNSFQVLIPEG